MQQRGEPCPREIPCTESLSYHNYRARAIGKEEKQARGLGRATLQIGQGQTEKPFCVLPLYACLTNFKMPLPSAGMSDGSEPFSLCFLPYTEKPPYP